MDKERVKAEIGMTIQRVAIMGANDYEFDELQYLLKLLEEDRINPEEALRQALAIEARKQDYH